MAAHLWLLFNYQLALNPTRMARSMDPWFAAYGESHQHPLNTAIHWICVPAIYFSIVGLLMCIPAPATDLLPAYPWAWASLVLVLAFYLPRSIPLSIAMVLWTALCIFIGDRFLHLAPWSLWSLCVTVFVLAWIGQFYGHKVEGKKPSFLKDVQFLLVGPAWLMAKLFRRWRLRY